MQYIYKMNLKKTFDRRIKLLWHDSQAIGLFWYEPWLQNNPSFGKISFEWKNCHFYLGYGELFLLLNLWIL